MATTFTKEYAHLAKRLGVANVHAAPRVTRVVVNVGVGKQRDNAAWLEAVRRDLAQLAGQAPQERRARKSVSGFNVREGNLVGLRVTLRGKRRDDFIRRFVNVTLPRVRDFRGISLKSFDGHGNLNVGLTEHLAFPEIQPEKTDVIFGVQVTFVTSAATNEEAIELFRELGFPLQGKTEGDEALGLAL